MKTQKLHNWRLSYAQAVALQKELAAKVQLEPLKSRPKLIAGLDCGFSEDGKKITAAVIVLRVGDFEIVETASATRKVNFPYIPGLLSFREGPVCIAAVGKLKTEPDLFLVDGQGIAHPRRLGLASHLGLFFNKPTIGCAKSRLTGSFEEPPLEKGGFSLLKDRRFTPETNRKSADQEIIGAVVRTRTNVKCVFISAGHKCTLQEAIDITLACTTKYRLPEPTRLAHQLVSRLKN